MQPSIRANMAPQYSDVKTEYDITLAAGEIGGTDLCCNTVETVGPNLVTDSGFDDTSLGANSVTGTDSDMSGANNWGNSGLATLDINTTVAGKMYMLGNGGADDLAFILATTTVGKTYFLTLKARLNAGASTAIYAGTALTAAAAVAGNCFALTPTGVEATYSGYFVAAATAIGIGIAGVGFNGIAFEIDDVTLQECTFDSWTAGTGWCPDCTAGALTGKARKVAGTAGGIFQARASTDRTDRFAFTIERTAGTVRYRTRAAVYGTTRSVSGTYIEDLTVYDDYDYTVIAADAAFAGTVDNVTVRTVTNKKANGITAEIDYDTQRLITSKTAASTTTVLDDSTVVIKEDYTGFADSSSGTASIATNVITVTAMDRDEDSYVTSDQGVGAITDFTHWVDVDVTALTDATNSGFGVWAVASADDDMLDIKDAGGDAILAMAYQSTADTHYQLKLYNTTGSTIAFIDASTEIAVCTVLYLSVNRTGTTLTIEIYSTDALRAAGAAGDIDTVSGTVQSTALRYVYGLASYNEAAVTGRDASGTISNLNLSPERTLIALHDSDNQLAVLYDGSRVYQGAVADASIVSNKQHEKEGDGSGTFTAKRLTLGAVEATGTSTDEQLYQIVTTAADHFFVGDEVDDYWAGDGVIVMDASNTTKKVN